MGNKQSEPHTYKQTSKLHRLKPIYEAAESGDGYESPAYPANDGFEQQSSEHAGDVQSVKATHPITIIGRSPSMLNLFSRIERFAQVDSPVLITGATGTGKELVAQSLHQKGARCRAPFIDLNCSAIPDTLFESELFGHQRGTFTGAHESRRGMFEVASDGTLFLDEVDALDMRAQAKLLRVLQEQCVRRIGGRSNIPVNVRIISATNSDIRAAVAEGKFRADLFFRLCVVPLHLPELYERGPEDISLLIEHFLRRYAQRRGLPLRRFTMGAKAILATHRWPGNVRELENTVEYALACGREEELGVEDLPTEVSEMAAFACSALQKFKSTLPLAEIERQYILTVFESCGGNQVKAAAALDIDRRTLHRKLRLYGVLLPKDSSSALT